MVRLRDSWPFSLSSAPTVGNPCRPLQPESVSKSIWEAHGKPKVGRDSPAGDDAKGGAVPGTLPQERERRSQAANAVPSLARFSGPAAAPRRLLIRGAYCSFHLISWCG